MKKFRKQLLEIKEGFLDAKSEKRFASIILANSLFLSFITSTIICMSTIFCLFNLEMVHYTITICTLLLFIFFELNRKAFYLLIPFSRKILYRLFGRYGRVVTKKDWANIKKNCPKVYRRVRSKKSIGYCYFYSWWIALFLDDAKLMYCIIQGRNEIPVAHAVIVKNNCVYDTNFRNHFDLEEYIDWYKVKIFKTFDKEEYSNTKFFDEIRDDWVKWCNEQNVECKPQISITKL